jgi:hypothetical protein
MAGLTTVAVTFVNLLGHIPMLLIMALSVKFLWPFLDPTAAYLDYVVFVCKFIFYSSFSVNMATQTLMLFSSKNKKK